MKAVDPGVAVTDITTQEALRDQGINPERVLAPLGVLFLFPLVRGSPLRYKGGE